MASDKGGFVWYELMTDDPTRARDFYRAVVGWEIAEEAQATATGTDYRMIARSDGGVAGGVLTLNDDMKAGGATPGWLGYIHHHDVDGAVATVKNAGGMVYLPPMDMPGVGRMAMVSDPWGAHFYVMRPTPSEGQPNAQSDVFSVDQPQHVRWNELWTPEPDAAIALYCELFGWDQEGEMEMGPMGTYRFLQHDGVGFGAVGPAQPDGDGPRWAYHLGVDDIDRAAKAVTDQGGRLVSEVMEIPGGEYAAYARDPSDAAFGIVGPRK